MTHSQKMIALGLSTSFVGALALLLALPNPMFALQAENSPISVRFEGELAAVQKALAALSAQAPAIVVDSMTLQVNNAVRTGAMPPMACTISLSVLRRLA